MFFKAPKDDKRFLWTSHVIGKMTFYRISPSMVKRIISFPERIEQGIAKNTVANMRLNRLKKKREEIWVMHQKKLKVKSQKSKLNNSKITIISAWRYPGKSPQRNPIPEEILEEAREFL